MNLTKGLFTFRPFSRYLNRGQKAAVEMKTDLTAYQQLPDMISKLDPSPAYPIPAMDPQEKVQQLKRNSTYNLERIRSSFITKQNGAQKASVGRLRSHFKLDEIRQEVQKIKEKELETKSSLKEARQKGVFAPETEVDDQFQLPYGYGFDHVIKKKAELIDGLKLQNNAMMDELIEKLGYMDYRDALACNKYIIEAKKSGDYHQIARSRVLEAAFTRLSHRRREEIETNAQKQASAEVPGSAQYRKAFEDSKLNQLMAQDSAVAELYQDTLHVVRSEKEFDINRIKGIHDRFDYFKDQDKMRNKIKSKMYDLPDEEKQTEDELMTTELSDQEANDMYKRYKYAYEQTKESRESLELREHNMIMQMQQQLKKEEGSLDEEGSGYEKLIEEMESKKIQKIKFEQQLENQMTEIRMLNSLKNMDINDVLFDGDQIFTSSFTPFRKFTEEIANDPQLPAEVRRIINLRKPQVQNQEFPVYDAASQKQFLDMNEFQMLYLKAKWTHYLDMQLQQMQITTTKIEEEKYEAAQHDEWVAPRIEFMYNYLDFKNDRHKVRDRFMKEMNRKTTLEDIGLMLDKFTLDSKATSVEYMDPARHLLEQPKQAKKDFSEADLDWRQSIISEFDPIKPQWLDDQSILATINEKNQDIVNDILDEVKFNDQQRDYSLAGLTADERQEIALFHSMKQDPFYKHHLRTHLAQFAEQINESALTMPYGPHEIDPDDFVKFDRINLYDLRRTLPQKEREPKLDSTGKAWGSGKRKTSIAVANVRAGSGKVVVNGKPLLNYFMMPSQRQRILLPLTVSQYTCLLDVNITVRGGGLTGQCEACVPAISKALQAYDVDTRPILKYLRLLRNDPRRVERKKPGLLKARKGQTYVRR